MTTASIATTHNHVLNSIPLLFRFLLTNTNYVMGRWPIKSQIRRRSHLRILRSAAVFAHSETAREEMTPRFRLAQNEILHRPSAACLGVEHGASGHHRSGSGGTLRRCVFERRTIVAVLTLVDVVAIVRGSSQRISGTSTE